jgi:sporulation protein YlmC with PRC-barrel domain
LVLSSIGATQWDKAGRFSASHFLEIEDFPRSSFVDQVGLKGGPVAYLVDDDYFSSALSIFRGCTHPWAAGISADHELTQLRTEESPMLRPVTELHGYSVLALDGSIGHVSDILFDDKSWLVRWVVVETGNWLMDRKVLLPTFVLGHLDHERREFSVRLNRMQIKDSPDIDTDKSVSRQMETNVYDHYGWTPYWGSGFYVGGGGYINGAMGAPYFEPGRRDKTGLPAEQDAGDAHLRSAAAVTGYHIHASDGDIGHVQDFLMEDADWSLRYLLVETTNWWAGKTVLISPQSVRKIEWSDRLVRINVDREKVKGSPIYGGPAKVDRAYTRSFNNYYADVVS